VLAQLELQNPPGSLKARLLLELEEFISPLISLSILFPSKSLPLSARPPSEPSVPPSRAPGGLGSLGRRRRQRSPLQLGT